MNTRKIASWKTCKSNLWVIHLPQTEIMLWWIGFDKKGFTHHEIDVMCIEIKSIKKKRWMTLT